MFFFLYKHISFVAWFTYLSCISILCLWPVHSALSSPLLASVAFAFGHLNCSFLWQADGISVAYLLRLNTFSASCLFHSHCGHSDAIQVIKCAQSASRYESLSTLTSVFCTNICQLSRHGIMASVRAGDKSLNFLNKSQLNLFKFFSLQSRVESCKRMQRERLVMKGWAEMQLLIFILKQNILWAQPRLLLPFTYMLTTTEYSDYKYK